MKGIDPYELQTVTCIPVGQDAHILPLFLRNVDYLPTQKVLFRAYQGFPLRGRHKNGVTLVKGFAPSTREMSGFAAREMNDGAFVKSRASRSVK